MFTNFIHIFSEISVVSFADILVRLDLFEAFPFRYSFVSNRKNLNSNSSNFRTSLLGLPDNLKITDNDFEIIHQNLVSLNAEWEGDLSHFEAHFEDEDEDDFENDEDVFNLENLYKTIKAIKETKYFLITRVKGI